MDPSWDISLSCSHHFPIAFSHLHGVRHVLALFRLVGLDRLDPALRHPTAPSSCASRGGGERLAGGGCPGDGQSWLAVYSYNVSPR